MFETLKGLESAFERFFSQPPAGTVAFDSPTQFKVYLTPVEVNGRWRIRCGKIDYVDTPVTAPKQKLNLQPAARAPVSTNKEPQPVKPVTQE